MWAARHSCRVHRVHGGHGRIRGIGPMPAAVHPAGQRDGPHADHARPRGALGPKHQVVCSMHEAAGAVIGEAPVRHGVVPRATSQPGRRLRIQRALQELPQVRLLGCRMCLLHHPALRAVLEPAGRGPCAVAPGVVLVLGTLGQPRQVRRCSTACRRRPPVRRAVICILVVRVRVDLR